MASSGKGKRGGAAGTNAAEPGQADTPEREPSVPEAPQIPETPGAEPLPTDPAVADQEVAGTARADRPSVNEPDAAPEPVSTDMPAGADAPPDLSAPPVPEPETPALEIPAPDLSEPAEPEAVPEKPETPAPAPAREERRRGGVFLPLLLGGAISAAAGFAAAFFLLQQGQGADDDAILAAINAQADRLGALEAQLAAPPEATVDLSPLADGQQALLDQFAALEQRMSELETRPDPAPADLSAVEAELSALRALIAEVQTDDSALEAQEAARAEAEAAAAEAARLAEVTARRAALARVQAAFDAGTAYEDALRDIGPADALPEPLAASAAQGVPTLAALRESFVSSARGALAAALPEAAGDAPLDRFAGFLRGQVAMRSLSPREGDDPDAILSRAEAALVAGDLAAALAEVETLPPAGRDAMAGWVTQAEGRLAAERALADLSRTINDN
ncbi:COG4223 family protein [Halodurantibacterium flavum]|uniref:Inner membrane protein n=1 Tax=Halodurantibacterium flavum TaxID=1382802 RepID=A0ABW4SB47_9RHOB